MSKKSKGAGHCVFCGSSKNLSKQHLWPDWIKDTLPSRSEQSHMEMNFQTRFVGNTAYIAPTIRPVRGPAGARKLRIVCETCNNRWMSVVESRAKPFAEKLILGEDVTLDAAAQEALSVWAVQMAAVSEYTDLATAAITPLDREVLRTSQQVPGDHWRIAIARYAGEEWKIRRSHFGCCLVVAGENRPKQAANYQATIFVVGSLLIYAASTYTPHLNVLAPPTILNKWRTITPAVGAEIIWADVPLLSDSEVNTLRDYPSHQMLTIDTTHAT